MKFFCGDPKETQAMAENHRKMRRKAIRVERVETFVRENEHGRAILDAFNAVDMIGIYLGKDENPDEYLRYAQRLVEALGKEDAAVSIYRMRELVEGSLLPGQLAAGQVNLGNVYDIACEIHVHFFMENLVDDSGCMIFDSKKV